VREKMQVELLIEALPYIRKFRENVFVVKIGGEITDPEKFDIISRDIALLHNVGIKVVVVHGGGKALTDMMKGEARFVEGLRYTDENTLKAAKKAFGMINARIVSKIKEDKESAIGIPGYKIAKAVRKTLVKEGKKIDIGFVGTVNKIDAPVLKSLLSAGKIPVISPLAMDTKGQIYNINADELATSISCAIHAQKIIFMTNVDGVMRDPNDPKTLISSLSKSEAQCLIQQGIISGGMIPKVKACLFAISKGVKKAHIINGNKPHAILQELFTDSGIGTMVIP
jgi:acetylglutamate kinase